MSKLYEKSDLEYRSLLVRDEKINIQGERNET